MIESYKIPGVRMDMIIFEDNRECDYELETDFVSQEINEIKNSNRDFFGLENEIKNSNRDFFGLEIIINGA